MPFGLEPFGLELRAERLRAERLTAVSLSNRRTAPRRPTAFFLFSIPFIVMAGRFSEVMQHYVNRKECSNGAVIVKKICGVLVLPGGVHLIYVSPQRR